MAFFYPKLRTLLYTIHIRPQSVNRFIKKNSPKPSFFKAVYCERDYSFRCKIKKQSLNRNSEKDSRKSVLNQTHIVGHGKPEKQISGTKNFTGTRAKPEAKIRWSSYDADSYMGRSRQGQSAYLFSTNTKI